jgi:hypothetical protein
MTLAGDARLTSAAARSSVSAMSDWGQTDYRLPIRMEQGQRHFVDQDHRPFLWHGDTEWELVRLLEVDEARALMERRKAQSFNVLLVMACGVGPGDLPNVHGQTPWVGNDPARPNEEYFRHVDKVLAAAGELGMTIVLGIYHQTHQGRLDERNIRPWARWIARRYAGLKHIIWSMYPKAERAYAPVCREAAAGLIEGDGGSHYITMHPDPSPVSSSFMSGEQWLSFDMIQTCPSQHLVHPMVSADAMRLPVRPVIFAEGLYEGPQFGRVNDPSIQRRQAWQAVLAGGWPVYGHSGNYETPATWRAWVDSPGARQMVILKGVIGGLDNAWLRVPDQSLFEDGPGSGVMLRAAATCPRGRWALAYLPEPKPAVIRMDRLHAGDWVVAQWINPVDGQRQDAGRHSHQDTPTLAPPAGWHDAVLLLTAE